MTEQIQPSSNLTPDPDEQIQPSSNLTPDEQIEANSSVQEQRVAFGTSGHRGSAFECTFNEWHVLAISQAMVDRARRLFWAISFGINSAGSGESSKLVPLSFTLKSIQQMMGRKPRSRSASNPLRSRPHEAFHH